MFKREKKNNVRVFLEKKRNSNFIKKKKTNFEFPMRTWKIERNQRNSCRNED